jgi:hypothetical protein
LRGQQSHLKQLPDVTMRTARGRHRHFWPSQQRVRNSVDVGGRTIGGSSSCNRGWAEQSTRLLELFTTGRTPEAVVPHLGATARQGVLQEAAHELHTREGLAAQLLAAVVTITKSDFTVLNALQPAVADSHPKDVAGQIVEHLPARPSCLAMGHPLFLVVS